MPVASASASEHKVVVGIADFAVSNDPSVVLATYSLGSCLGITIYDPAVKVGGLLHIMLPSSTLNPAKAATSPAMFVDTGVPALFRAAYKLGADKFRMRISVAGGARIIDNGGTFNIGQRNYDSLKGLFDQHRLPIVAQDVGGMVNRTLFFSIATGAVRLRISGQPDEKSL